MKITIEKKTADKKHLGKIIFDNNLTINFTITDVDLKYINDKSLLKEIHTGNSNYYSKDFEPINDSE